LGRHWASCDPLAGPNGSVAKVQALVSSSKETAQLWRYTTEEQENDWTSDRFDDNRWKLGPGGFGTNNTPGAIVRTVWDSPDIWLRKSFDLAEVPADGKLFLEMHHDEDAEIYINGNQVKNVEGFVTRYLQLPLDPATAKTLRKGRNTIAVHCHNTTGGQYIDVGLLMCRPNGTVERTVAGAESPGARTTQRKDANENRKR
jgi:hypothetical protein